AALGPHRGGVEIQAPTRRVEVLHRGIARVQIAWEAAEFQLDPVGVLEVDGLGPAVVDHIGDVDAAGEELPPLFLQSRFRAGLEREVVEAARHPEPTVDSRVVPCRYAGHSTRLHEGDELVAPGVEEDMADLPTFLDRDGVAAHRFESEDALVEVTSLVEIQRRQTDMREPLVGHVYLPFASRRKTRGKTSRSSPEFAIICFSGRHRGEDRVRLQTQSAPGAGIPRARLESFWAWPRRCGLTCSAGSRRNQDQ